MQGHYLFADFVSRRFWSFRYDGSTITDFVDRTSELQLPQELIVNYNQTVSGVRGMVTAPTGLESTSVVFAYGLDLYCTRVAPSKGFDLLKDDFDHYVITIVLCALIAAAFITRKLSQRKALKQAWR